MNPVPGWAILAGVGAFATALLAVVYGYIQDVRLQRRRMAEERAWLDRGGDWLYDSGIDQQLEER